MLKNNFAQNFGILYKKNGLTQETMGKIIGKGRSVVGSYLRGESEPDINILIKIADYFGVSIEVLLVGDVLKHYETNSPIIKSVEDPVKSYNNIQEKYNVLKEFFGIDSSSKLDTIVNNQEKILNLLDRDFVKDNIKRIKTELGSLEKKDL